MTNAFNSKHHFFILYFNINYDIRSWNDERTFVVRHSWFVTPYKLLPLMIPSNSSCIKPFVASMCGW